MGMNQFQSEATDFWEDSIYSQGRHLNLYPFDVVVSFLFCWRPQEKPSDQVRVLEIGCGAGNNLWFAAREGFKVSGIDGSSSAVKFAKNRFAKEGLEGDLREGNFLELPYAENTFDLGIDRCSLVCVGFESQKIAISEMHRVLRPGGIFFFNGYSDQHTSAISGDRLEDGRIANIRAGKLTGVGALAFNSREQVAALFSKKWEILKMEHMVSSDLAENGTGVHAEWRIVARKK